MEEKKLDLKISYADDVLPDAARDANAIRNLNDWLEPVIRELIANDVKAELYIDEKGINHLTFSKNISHELLSKAQFELEKYQFRLTGLG